MAQLDKEDLKQMNRSYFQSLSQERLVEVAENLHQLATELWKKQQQSSENSSVPPSFEKEYAEKFSANFGAERQTFSDGFKGINYSRKNCNYR